MQGNCVRYHINFFISNIHCLFIETVTVLLTFPWFLHVHVYKYDLNISKQSIIENKLIESQ